MLVEIVLQRIAGDAVLLHRIAGPYGNASVAERLVVDGYAERRADFVLAAIELPDVALVVLRPVVRAQRRLDVDRAFDELGLVARQREDGDLNRRDLRVKPQHSTLRLFAVGVDAAL